MPTFVLPKKVWVLRVWGISDEGESLLVLCTFRSHARATKWLLEWVADQWAHQKCGYDLPPGPASIKEFFDYWNEEYGWALYELDLQ